MCNNYPNCEHKSRVLEQQGSLLRHCETNLSNVNCPYISLGCLGCTFKEKKYTYYSQSNYMSIRGQKVQ